MKPRNVRNLDILRSVAVLAVLFAHSLRFLTFHIGPAARINLRAYVGGFGVLLFFVHTAFVLMLSMERTSDRGQWVQRFYVQRIFRIYPLALFFIGLALAFQIPSFFDTGFIWPSWRGLMANLALVQSITGQLCISRPMWSLSFEIQMYAILPAIFWFVSRYKRESIGPLIAVSVILPLAEMMIFPGSWLTGFFPCFTGGVLAYVTRDRRPILPAVTWPLLIGLFGVAAYWSQMMIGVEWAGCLLLGMLIPFFRDAKPGLFPKAAALIARYSYGIYLCHVPLAWLFFERLHMPVGIGGLVYLASVCMASVLLYHLLEAPMIQLGRHIGTRLERRPVVAYESRIAVIQRS